MKLKFGFLAILPFLFVACSDDDDDNNPETPGDTTYEVPTQYVFTDADGNNTVSYSGQAERQDQLSEITNMMKIANTPGEAIQAQNLRDMYANVNDNGNGNFSFSSTKQLRDKTADTFSDKEDIRNEFELWMDELAAISATTVAGETNGTNGVAGIVETNGVGPYLMNEYGFEYVQLIEKGLMGAVFYNQIVDVYLSDTKIGDGIDNSAPVDPAAGKYYTTMEHHWDEAFGYFTTATDFPANGTDKFWGKYSNTVDPHLGTNQKLMDAFLKGRAAISNGDMATKNQQRAIIRTELEKVVAGTAIHYLNEARKTENFSNDARRNHQLSEAVAFISSLKYNSNAAISPIQVQEYLDQLGGNLYETTISDITAVRDQLSTAYGMDSVKESL